MLVGGVKVLKLWQGNHIAPHSDPWYRFFRVIQLVTRCCDIPDGTKWLDVGCQMGQFIKLLQENVSVRAWGIDDFDQENVVEVCRKYLLVDLNSPEDVMDGTWHYAKRRIDQGGFSLGCQFQFISALEVIEHIVDTDMFLAECRNHLVENGVLVISTPNINSLRNRILIPFGRYPAGMEFKTVVHHVRIYNADKLRLHAGEHGFDVCAIAGVSFLPRATLKWAAMRWIDQKLSDWMPSLCGNIIAVFKLRGG